MLSDMQTTKWLNPALPQTLGTAVLLLYINAFFALLGRALFSPIGLAVMAAMIAGGYGIANERKWGYQVALAAAFSPFAIRFIILGPGGILSAPIISLMFDIALIALLLHPQSRDYQRIWFK